MRVISLKPLHEFWQRYPDAEQPLRQWYKTASLAEWNSLQDTRRDYPHADGVSSKPGETLTVFNIAGNKYRLVVEMQYRAGIAWVKFVGTHATYDRINVENVNEY